MKSFYIHTYGCQMNAHESDRLRHMLLMVGFFEAQTKPEADVVIFQTCSVRDTASRKVFTHISQARKLPRKPTICVIGCLSALSEKIEGVDILLGTNQLEVLVEKLSGTKPDTRFGIENSIIIMHGCNNFCSYCIVPYARGREFSRDSDDIINEFMQVKNVGRVIYLLGQNVNSYKCPRTGTTFVELVDRICAIEGDFQLNFISSHPKDFSEELVDCIARNKKIERNIHLPIQSGNDRILKLMGRGYTAKEYLDKIMLLRKKVPNVRITTDVICGFPGESEEEFEDTKNLFKQVRFNAAFIFPYSERKGTRAATMEGRLSTKIKKERTTELVKLQRVLQS
ncbi:MAG: MiaB/RimO family radical SAM methylthiotransferase [Firmicutes bacterium]|nr:MiaB/RimO family radical SAM methylthiotransferase [Bacillota bacterium]